MRSDLGAEDAGAATTLGLDELLAMKPLRAPPRRERGGRGLGGARPGIGRAESLDFDGVSPYAPGDDVRRIDWRASARTGGTEMRRFAAESHAARMIALDLRPDLYFGLSERFLAKSAALTAARLAWEAEALGEPVGLVAPGIDPEPPRRGRRAVARLLSRVVEAYDAARQGAEADPAALLAQAAETLKARDEIHMIGDFETDGPALDETARRLSARLRLFAWVVEDRALLAPAPAGRYPLSAPGGARIAIVLGRSAALAAPEAAARRRAARRARLALAGWEPGSALDLLPRAEAGA